MKNKKYILLIDKCYTISMGGEWRRKSMKPLSLGGRAVKQRPREGSKHSIMVMFFSFHESFSAPKQNTHWLLPRSFLKFLVCNRTFSIPEEIRRGLHLPLKDKNTFVRNLIFPSLKTATWIFTIPQKWKVLYILLKNFLAIEKEKEGKGREKRKIVSKN